MESFLQIQRKTLLLANQNKKTKASLFQRKFARYFSKKQTREKNRLSIFSNRIFFLTETVVCVVMRGCKKILVIKKSFAVRVKDCEKSYTSTAEMPGLKITFFRKFPYLGSSVYLLKNLLENLLEN